MGASALAIAAAFAVAFAMLVSFPSTAEAQVAPTSVNPGGTATITVSGENVLFTIAASSSATGVFTHSSAADGGQSILCADNGGCDTDDSDNGSVAVQVRADRDSPKGHLIVTAAISGGATQTYFVNVTIPTPVVDILIGKPTTEISSGGNEIFRGSIPASPDATDGTDYSFMTVLLRDRDGNGIDRAVEIRATTSLGNLSVDSDPGDGAAPSFTDGGDDCDDRGTCVFDSLVSDPDTTGQERRAQVLRLTGNDTPGIATITVTSGDLTETIDIVLHGDPKSISTEPMQNAVNLGGATFAVVTILDSAGNGVAAQIPTVGTGADVPKGPTGTGRDVRVSIANDVDFTGKPGTADDIPDCSTGTNDDGKCVFEIYAPKKGNDRDGGADPSTTDPDSANATRGTNTVTIVLSAITPSANSKSTFTIEVSGDPASFTTDAPASVEPLSTTVVTVTAVDDEGVAIGAQAFDVVKVEGEGAITSQSANTSNGVAKFTYVAPTGGTATFLITVGSGSSAVVDTVSVDIATPEPPAPPTPPVSVSAQSGLVVVQNAGSIDDILGALDCGSQTGTTVTLPGNNIYAVGAPSVVNAGFLANVSFPIELAAAYVSCGG